ncbi:hypothetical protein ACOMHN_061935 [Nucella lapillus]
MCSSNSACPSDVFCLNFKTAPEYRGKAERRFRVKLEMVSMCSRQKLLAIFVFANVVAFIVFVHVSYNIFSPQKSSPQQTTNNNTATAADWNPRRPESHHLFFLKVHKAASTTVQNLLYRFAISHHLLVLLPQPQHRNVLNERSKDWLQNAIPLPKPATHFDIICNHLIFEEQSVRKVLPHDAFFVGIVRQPFQQFASAFWFYREAFDVKYLKEIPGPHPVSEYLEHPTRYEPKAGVWSFTHNRMSFDFGMDVKKTGDETYVEMFITYLNFTFDLVMVSERFDESILLLRRLLGWKVQDVLYLRNNAFHKNRLEQNFTQRERQAHRVFNRADYALYEHFSRVLDAKVRAAGDGFQAELKAYRTLLRSVHDYCQKPGGPEGSVKVRASFWGEEVLLTSGTCHLMSLEETDFVKVMRRSNAAVIRKERGLGSK